MLAASISAAVWVPAVSAIAVAAVTWVSALQLAAYKRKKEAEDEATQALRHNRDPMLRAVFDLQSRIYNIVAKEFLRRYWKAGDKEERTYALASTLWILGQYLGWVEILRREVQYLDIGSRVTNREVQRRLNDVSAALASDSDGEDAYFTVFRSDQRAIGEFMVTERGTQSGKRPDCLGYSEFIEALVRLSERAAERRPEALESPVFAWYRRFAAEFELAAGAQPTDTSLARLVRVQRRLINLLDLLDPERLRYPNPDLRGKLPWPRADTRPRSQQVARFVWSWRDPWPDVDRWARRYRLTCTADAPTKRSFRGRRGPLGGRPEFRLVFDGEWFTISAWTAVGRRSKRIDGSLRSSRARLALDGLLKQYDRPRVNVATRPFRTATWVRRRVRAPRR